MKIRNENTVLRTHCDDSDGFFWISSMESLRKIIPGHTHVVFVEAPESMTYGDRLRFMGCYELTGIAGKTFIYSLVSREFDLASANDVKLAA